MFRAFYFKIRAYLRRRDYNKLVMNSRRIQDASHSHNM